MAALILRRSIYRHWICARPTARRISSSAASSSPRPWLLLGDCNEIEIGKGLPVGGVDNYEDYPVEDYGVDKLLYKFYSLADDNLKIYNKRRGKDAVVVGSSHGWLALYKRQRNLFKWRHVNKGGFDMFLYNPVSQRQVNLPSVESLPISIPDDVDTSSPEHISILKMYRPKKVILSSSPEDNDEECRAIMSYGPEDRLAYCCPGSSKHWIPMGDSYHENEPINEHLIRSGYATGTRYPRIYEDFVYSMTKKLLFCTTKFDNFECWDVQDPLCPTMNWKKIPGDGLDYDEDNYPFPMGDSLQRNNGLCRTWKYLVYAEKSSRLFLVRRIVMEKINPRPDIFRYKGCDGLYQTVGFDVHEIMVDDPAKKGELRYMGDGSLDGMAFFIGSTGHGFVIEEEWHRMIKNNVKPNCIYFTDPKELTPLVPWDDYPLYGGHDLGIFNYKKKAFSCLYKYPCDLREIRRIDPTPTWFTPSSSP